MLTSPFLCVCVARSSEAAAFLRSDSRSTIRFSFARGVFCVICAKPARAVRCGGGVDLTRARGVHAGVLGPRGLYGSGRACEGSRALLT